MTIEQQDTSVDRLLRAQNLRRVAELDYRRALVEVSASRSQRVVAELLHIRQPTVNESLKAARRTPPAKAGFSGAGPYEICQRYAAGLLTQTQVVDELTRWDYAPSDRTDGYDSLLTDPPGSRAELVDAYRDGLIEKDVYIEVAQKVTHSTA